MIRTVIAAVCGICVGIIGTLGWFTALALMDDERNP